MDANGWKAKIRELAVEIGFAAVAFTDAEPISELESFLIRRREAGRHTSFEHEESALCTDPKRIWSECRTVVALACPLPLTGSSKDNEGVIARSGIGEDYHRTLKRYLSLLISKMTDAGWPGVPPHIQVDTGPLNERALANKAGLGWLGHNQQLIIPGLGSFVSLALMLLDQELPVDFSLSINCGSCRHCIEACPLSLLSSDDFAANQCLAYLTQSKEILTDKQRGALGLRVFGCDTCQEACPHNSHRLDREKELQDNGLGIDLWETLNLTKSRFEQQLKLTAAGWRGKGILQRNAFLALKTLEDPGIAAWVDERNRQQNLLPLIKPYCN